MSMKPLKSTLTNWMVVLGLSLLAGCCTPQRRADPSLPLLQDFPKQGYRVKLHGAESEFRVPSVRFDGDWVILEGGYPAAKAIWIPRSRLESITEPRPVQ
jgi:hypothetical protein